MRCRDDCPGKAVCDGRVMVASYGITGMTVTKANIVLLSGSIFI